MKSRASCFNLISTKSRIFKWNSQVYQNKTLQNVSADHNNTIMTADRCNSLWSSGKGKTFYTHNLVHPKVWQTCCTIFEFELLIHCWFLWLQHETNNVVLKCEVLMLGERLSSFLWQVTLLASSLVTSVMSSRLIICTNIFTMSAVVLFCSQSVEFPCNLFLKHNKQRDASIIIPFQWLCTVGWLSCYQF